LDFSEAFFIAYFKTKNQVAEPEKYRLFNVWVCLNFENQTLAITEKK